MEFYWYFGRLTPNLRCNRGFWNLLWRDRKLRLCFRSLCIYCILRSLSLPLCSCKHCILVKSTANCNPERPKFRSIRALCNCFFTLLSPGGDAGFIPRLTHEPLTNWQDPRSRPCTATKIPVPCNLALLLLHYFYAPIANAFTKWLPLIFLSAENCPHFSDKTFLYLQLCSGEIFRTPGADFLPSSKRDYVPINRQYSRRLNIPSLYHFALLWTFLAQERTFNVPL